MKDWQMIIICAFLLVLQVTVYLIFKEITLISNVLNPEDVIYIYE